MAKSTASHLIDEILQTLGVWGKYQIIQLAVILSLSWPASHQLYSIIYIGYQPPLRCHHPVNSSLYTNTSDERPFHPSCKVLFEKTNVTSCPHGYDYDLPKNASFATEWDLVCGEDYQAQLSQTMLVLGQAVGATTFTFIADRIGRMKACIISQWMMLAISTGAIFAPTPVIYTFIKFLIGVAQQGHVTAIYVMPLEVLPTTRRAVPHLLITTIWSSFLGIQVAIAYFLRDHSWRYTQVVYTISSLLTLIPNMLLLDESIRWLFANEKIERVKKLIQKATRLNKASKVEVESKTKACIEETAGELHTTEGIDDDNNDDDATENDVKVAEKSVEKVEVEHTEKEDEETAAKHKGTLLDILKNRRLRITTFIMFFSWIVNSLTSFGLSLTAAKLSGDRFVNYILLAVIPIPAGFLSYYTLIRFGRKKTSILFHAIAGLSLITSVLLNTFIGESASDAVVTFTMIGRFGISASWNVLFLYTPELYPTNLRSLGLGISSSSSRIGGMLAPFSNIVIDYIPWLPGTVYGCSCLIVCLLTLYLPETLNRELPQTLDEIKRWNQEMKLKKKGNRENGETVGKPEVNGKVEDKDDPEVQNTRL